MYKYLKYKCIINMYKYLKILLFQQTAADGLCLPRAILQQVLHHKHTYTPEMAFRQVALHMLHHPSKFYCYMEQEFAETGEYYESYVTNIFRGKVWGNDLVTAAFGHMWNIAITVVSPSYTRPQHLFHNKT